MRQEYRRRNFYNCTEESRDLRNQRYEYIEDVILRSARFVYTAFSKRPSARELPEKSPNAPLFLGLENKRKQCRLL